MPIVEKNKIIFNAKDWLAGLNPQYGNSASLNQKIGDGLPYQRSFDPYRFLGYASPGFDRTDLTNVAVIDGVQTSIAINGTKAYTVGGTKLHQITILTGTITNDTNFPRAVAGAQMQAARVYRIGATPYLFYSWYDGTDGDVGRYDFSTTFADNFMSATPDGKAVFNKNNPMPMIVGDDDILYIADGNQVHAFDGQTGASGTLSKGVLVLPSEYIITGFARFRQSLVVFAYSSTGGDSFYSGKAKAFFWNYSDLDPTDVVDLNDNYVSAPFEYKGTIGCFTQGRAVDKATVTRFSKLKIFDGSVFQTKAKYIGNAPTMDGVDVVEDMICFNANGVIFQFGNPYEGVPDVLNQVAEGSGTSSGILRSISSSLQIASSGATTTGGLQSLNSGYFSQAQVATSLAQVVIPHNKICRVTGATVRYAKTSTAGRNLTIILKDRYGNSLQIVTNAGTIAAADLILPYFPTTTFKFEALKASLAWSVGTNGTDAPIVDAIEVEFEVINK